MRKLRRLIRKHRKSVCNVLIGISAFFIMLITAYGLGLQIHIPTKVALAICVTLMGFLMDAWKQEIREEALRNDAEAQLKNDSRIFYATQKNTRKWGAS